MSQEDAVELLNQYYQYEVYQRNGTFAMTEGYMNQIKQFAMVLTDPEIRRFGVYICGKCGNGKTTLLKAFQRAESYLDKQFNAFAEDMRITHKRYDVQVIDARKLAVIAKSEEQFRGVMECNVLCIDDCGNEPTEVMDYGNVLSPLTEILEYRYTHQLFTVMTSNLRPSEFASKYGERVADRMREMTQTIVFQSPSYRK